MRGPIELWEAVKAATWAATHDDNVNNGKQILNSTCRKAVEKDKGDPGKKGFKEGRGTMWYVTLVLVADAKREVVCFVSWLGSNGVETVKVR